MPSIRCRSSTANTFAAIFPLYLFRVTGHLLENDRADSIYQNAIFEMPAHGLGQDAPLDLPADSNHIVNTVPVRNVRDILGSGSARHRAPR